MIYLSLNSEYSFQKCYYFVNNIVNDAIKRGDNAVGIADLDNTFAHVKLRNECKKAGIKPIFGVKIRATEETVKSRSYKKTYGSIIEVTFIAKNNDGLIELYKLVGKSYDQFYYFPRLSYKDVSKVSDNIFIFIKYIPERISISNRNLIRHRVDYNCQTNESLDGDVAMPLILYPNKNDKGVYEVLSHDKGSDIKTYKTYIRSEKELIQEGYSKEAIKLTDIISKECNAELKQAEMVKFKEKKDLYNECVIGAIKKCVDLNDPIYKERLEKEISIIKERGFQDYFFIVSDVLKWAKKRMLVGCGRGSSGGSLVCYLLSITEIDPIKYGLIFERFIDLNRVGLPDIDTDIPDISRNLVIKYLEQKYGKDNVIAIGIISTFKSKSSIDKVAKALDIPKDDIEKLKNSILVRQGGDDRADMCIKDTFDETDIGKETLSKYPELRIAEKIEAHASHASRHAAGIIVSNDPLYNFTGINHRDSIIMMGGKEAESQGLLKIDVLGLRTLSILEETAKLSGFDYEDFYKLDFNDFNVFDIFNEDRVHGIFQFEGPSTRSLTNQIEVDEFEDLCILTALSRPGALVSGEAARWVKRKNELEPPTYYGSIHEQITKSTYGSIVFQEQVMVLLREYAGMIWSDVNILRNAISKSYGDEFFTRYKQKFIDGAKKIGRPELEIEKVWKTIASMGSYSFNQSHAVAYSMISYWTAWAKAYHPLEFAAANLNNAKDEDNALKILRDFVINDDIEYVPIDTDVSDINWTINDGKLIGGFMNLHGVGIQKARQIIKARNGEAKYTPSIVKKLLNPETPFDILFPTKHYFGDYYSNPQKYGLRNQKVSLMKDVQNPGEYIVIGKLKFKDLIFRNSPQLVLKRGGKVVMENLYYLKMIIEDDTGDIMAQIAPFKFEELHGKLISESIVVDKTWLIIKGTVQKGYRTISIDAIQEIYIDEK